MKKTQKRLGNKGFSLVELIVVIAIMAVLVGVLAPTLIKNVEKSRESTDVQNLDSLRGSVVTMLSNEKNYEALVPTATGVKTATYVVTFTKGSGCSIDGTNAPTAFTGTVKKAIEDELYETVGDFAAKSKTAKADGVKIQFSVSDMGKVSAEFNGAKPKYVDTFVIE